ncbi:MAG: translation elongation factor 4 [Mycoplasmataceae bacterium]|jgi:GTP-binding protein LepA|nr:translation elongation factor 4 [Mycoplasmataceae bacterium]
MDKTKIRNFCIIAHIDHGKSTLSDRLIELCDSIDKHEMKNQILDSMDLERERGITIKLNAIQLQYKDYIFHLIDTPGHVDFSYEVSRSLAACEGAILVVDASQGVEAQTISNVILAIENNLDVFLVINKIDLPGADIEKTKNQVKELIRGIEIDNCPCISAKSGLNIEDVCLSIINKVKPPKGLDVNKLQGLIFDSYFDKYKGVVCLVRIMNGILKKGQKVLFMSNKKEYLVAELGVRTPNIINKEYLETGEVGWFAAGIKSAKEINVGDTITLVSEPAAKALPGYKKVLPIVYAGIFPLNTEEYEKLKDAMVKISLSDSALEYEYETSKALGFGVRCGFLGLLHMEIIKERINREFNIEIIISSPSVKYKINKTNNEIIVINSPSDYPDRTTIRTIEEPFVKMSISTTEEYIGNITTLCKNSRGVYKDLIHNNGDRYILIFELPLAEIITNFFSNVESISKGYASIDYEVIDYRSSDLVKVDVLLNSDKIDAFSFITHRDNAETRARKMCEKLKEHIPKQQFEVPVQAAIGGKIIARETIKAMYRNVLAKCYGGDITRKMKLLEQQKAGKKRLKMLGSVSLPDDIFIKILKEE